jgi:hypothetical protein
MDTVLNRSDITEWGICEEPSEVIILGFRFQDGAPIGTLIVQIEKPTSGLARDSEGMHVEIGDNAFYGGVTDFKYDEVNDRVRLALHPGKHKGLGVVEIEIPQPVSADQRQLLRQLANAYDSSLRQRN